MRPAAAFGACLASLLAVAAHASDQYPDQRLGLKIEVSARFDDSYSWSPSPSQAGGGEWTWGGGFLDIEIALRNVGDSPITVPTRPYFPAIRRPVPTWSPSEFLVVAIEVPEFRRSSAKFNESRFDPVTLNPGEAVLVEHVSFNTTALADAKRVQTVIARFAVSPGFPRGLKWWTGIIGTEQPVEKHWMEKPKSRAK